MSSHLESLRKDLNIGIDLRFKKNEQRAKDRIQQDLFTRLFSAAIAHEKYEILDANPYAQEKWKLLLQQVEELEAKDFEQTGNLHARDSIGFICTINPPPSVTFENFETIVLNTLSSDVFSDETFYTFEQRSSSLDEDCYGWHCHIVAIRTPDQVPSDIKKCIRSKSKKLWLPNKPTTNQLNIRWLKQEKDYINALKYIREPKSDPKKLEKQKKDLIFREIYGLKPFYQKGLNVKQEKEL